MSEATARNIQRLMMLTGVTHERLGKVAGVSRSAVSHWVSGKTEPRMGPIQRIADEFGITKSNIIEPDGMEFIKVDSWTGRLYDIRGDEESAYRSAYEHRQEFGEALGEILERREVSPSELARRLHVDGSYVESIVDCTNHSVSMARAFQIADALGLSLSEMVQYIEGVDVISTPEEDKRTRAARKRTPEEMESLVAEIAEYIRNNVSED